MPRIFLGFVLAAVVGLGMIIAIAANSQFTFAHPRDKSIKVLSSAEHGAIVLREMQSPVDLQGNPVSQPSATASAAVPLPKVVFPEPVYDFGRMDPLTMGKHSFEVRNEGTAPLELEVAGTTCKCTVGGVSEKVVAPGKSTFVTLEWNSGSKQISYEQAAEIRTNDPLKKTFVLKVHGRVRMLFGSELEEVIVPQVEPGKGATTYVVLYSQIWDGFEVLEFKSQLAGLRHEFVDVVADEKLQAKSAQKLVLHIPGDLPDGDFQDLLRIKVTPRGGNGQTYDLELPLHGRTLKRFTIYGEFGSDDTLELGDVPQGTSKTVKLLVKVRDDLKELAATEIQTTPSFLQVTLQPHPGDPRKGLYDLQVVIPADAPVGQFLGSPQGEISVKTNHPRIPQIKLQARFAVTP